MDQKEECSKREHICKWIEIEEWQKMGQRGKKVPDRGEHVNGQVDFMTLESHGSF